MTDDIDDILDRHPGPKAPKIKRRRRVMKRRTAKPEVARSDDEFAGLTSSNCCSACRKGHCTITESPFCGHPYKSAYGLGGPVITQRIARARKAIEHQKIDAERAA